MEIKGTAVKTIMTIVKTKFPDRYNEWFQSLSKESQQIFDNPILANEWYPLQSACVLPTRQVAKLFYDNDSKKGAWEAGRFSAEQALTGIYRIFIRAAAPSYVISRASKIFSTYYKPSVMTVVDKKDKGVTVHITEFPTPDRTVEYRIAGWMQRALELSKCNGVKVQITKSMTLGHPLTEFVISWQ